MKLKCRNVSSLAVAILGMGGLFLQTSCKSERPNASGSQENQSSLANDLKTIEKAFANNTELKFITVGGTGIQLPTLENTTTKVEYKVDPAYGNIKDNNFTLIARTARQVINYTLINGKDKEERSFTLATAQEVVNHYAAKVQLKAKANGKIPAIDSCSKVSNKRTKIYTGTDLTVEELNISAITTAADLATITATEGDKDVPIIVTLTEGASTVSSTVTYYLEVTKNEVAAAAEAARVAAAAEDAPAPAAEAAPAPAPAPAPAAE